MCFRALSCFKKKEAVQKKPFLNKFSLAFLQESIEKKYYQKENEMQLLSLRRILILINVYYFYNALVGEIAQWPNNYLRWIRLFVALIGALLLFLIYKYSKLKFLVQYLLTAATLAFFFTVSELIYANFPNLSSGQLFFQSTVNMISISYLVIIRIRWRLNFLVISVVFVYIGFRFLEITNFDQTDYFFNLLLLFLCFFIWLYLHYFHEKHDRKQFYLIEKGQERLKNYKKLMEDIMPTPIIMLPNDYETTKKVVFFNNSAKSLFGNVDDDETIFNLINNNIKAEEQVSTSSPTMQLKNNEKIQIQRYSSSSRIIVERPETFVRFIRSKLMESSGVNRFQETFAFFKTSMDSSCHFEAKFGNIFWGEEDDEVILLILNDITSTKKIAELEVMNNNKDRLLATVSHDLRTPLNGLIGMLEVCKDMVTEPVLKKNIKVSLSSAKILLHVINDLIDFSIITQNFYTPKLEVRPVRLNNILVQVSKLIKFQAKRKGLTFTVENELYEEEQIILADEIRLKQILMNLLMNALKYTSTGFIRLRVIRKNIASSIRVTSLNNILLDDEEYAEFMVEDSGCGIKCQDIENLFKLKNIKEEKSLNKTTGIGLGLTISQIFAKMHVKSSFGGIQVESNYGSGSKFFFPIKISGTMGSFKEFENCDEGEHAKLLPNEEHEDSCRNILPNSKPFHENEVQTWCWSESESFSRHNKENQNSRIYHEKIRRNSKLPPPKSRFVIRKVDHISVLVVDDDQINILVATNFLKSLKINFTTANNGLEAVEQVRNLAGQGIFFDAILMDCNMPIMDGYEATRIINEMMNKAEIKKCFIIALTANTDPADVEFCFSAGMHYYLNKPLTKLMLKDLFAQIFKINID